MKKRIAQLLLVFVIIFTQCKGSLLSLGTKWKENGEYVYKIDGNGRAVLLQYHPLNESNTIITPVSIDGYFVGKIETHCYDCRGIKKIEISSPQTTVCSEAFLNCDRVEELYLYDDTRCSTDSFSNLINLSLLDIAYSCGYIENYSLDNPAPWQPSANMIVDVNLAEGIHHIGDYAFYDTVSLLKIDIPSTMKTIGNYAFCNSNCISSIDLKNSVVSLGSHCFYNENLQYSLILPQSVSFIGEDCLNSNGEYFCFENSYASTYLKENQFNCTIYDPSFENSLYSISLTDSIKFNLIDMPAKVAESSYYYSSDENVASIDGNGSLVSYKTGLATVSLISDYFQYDTKVNVTIENSELETKAINIKTGNTYQCYNDDFSELKSINMGYSYYSLDEKIATVDDNGLITAKKKGTTFIRVEDDQGNKAQYLVKISNFITSLSLNADRISLHNGESFQLKASIKPSNAENSVLSYSSSDKNIVKVSKNGKITAVKEGSATITVKTTDGSELTKKVVVTVTKDKITVNSPELPMMIGKSYQLRASCSSGKKLVYHSKDKSIVSVDENGKMTAHKAGEVVVTISTSDGLAFYSVLVRVYPNAVAYGIDISQWQGKVTLKQMQTIKEYGIDFVYIRAAYDVDYEDPRFRSDLANAQAAGLDCGPYHYIMATTPAQAKKEAEFMLSVIKGMKFEYPVMLDIEDSVHKNLSASQFSQIITAYCETIKQGGYEVIVYSYASLLNHAGSLNGKYDFYMAHWDRATPNVFKYPYTIWQFTSSGRLPSFSGRLDMDISFFDYPSYYKKNHLNGY